MAVPNQTITHHHVGEIKAEFKAGMRAEDFPHLANLLVNLYSDPIKAIEQEYACNALDAHIEAGNPDPIQITLPTQSHPNFVVQDYGIGLSIDDLENVYSMYGRSLKRESNKMVGQLGLGCKSGLTYADAFTITAVKDGVKCVAMSTKDEHGVGTIRVIDTVATDERNGVRIDIPVRNYDIEDFRRTAKRLFQFWDEGTVLIDGEAPEVPEWRKQALALDDDTWVIPTKNDVSLHSSYIIMGNVAYEAPDAQYGPRHKRTYHRFVARVNMGDVDFVPSREAMHFTPHTNACLAELNDFIEDRFDRVLGERLAKCPTRWDETMLKVHWRGSSVRVNASQAMPIWSFDPNGWQRKAKAHTAYNFSSLTNSKIVVITGFPNRSLSSVHRERLLEMHPGCTQFIVIPQGSDASGLGGRGNTFTWDEVLAATGDPSTGKAKVARTKRDETRYSTLSGPSYTATELAALSDTVLYLYPREHYSVALTDCITVKLYSSNQIDRLKRMVPGIRHYHEELADRQEAVRNAITDYDRRLVAAQRLHSAFTRIDPTKIIDTELAEAIRMSKMQSTSTIADAIRMGISVDNGTRDVNKVFVKRYPLLNPSQQYYAHKLPLEDVVMYINTKYPSIAAEKMSDTLDYEISEDSLDAVAS